jgi:hypothetical protein
MGVEVDRHTGASLIIISNKRVFSLDTHLYSADVFPSANERDSEADG